MIEGQGHAADDRQAEAEARLLAAAGPVAAPEELVEDEVAFLGGDAAARVGHFDPDSAGPAPGRQDDPAGAGQGRRGAGIRRSQASIHSTSRWWMGQVRPSARSPSL